jgi:hypothetical protein
MDDSYISHGKGGTMFSGPDAVRLFQAMSLHAGLGLLKAGIKPTRDWTITKALHAAAQYTGKTYKRTEIDRARIDLKIWIDTMRSALPIERSNDQ